MTPFGMNPFRELEVLRHEVERAFQQFGLDLSGNGTRFRAAFLPGRAARTYPLMNVGEDKDHVYVEALAPGLNPDSLNISVLRNTLRVEGEKQALSEEIKPEQFHRSERSAGRFVRTIELPTEIRGDDVKCDYRNGMLHITLPKAEEAKPRQITVNVQ